MANNETEIKAGELIQWPIKRVNLEELKPFERNPRKISRENYKRLKDKIIAIGFNSPIVASHDLRIIGGHQRLKVLKELGVKDVMVSVAPYEMTEKQFRKALVENNISDGAWDIDMLEEDFEVFELEEYGVDRPTLRKLTEKEPATLGEKRHAELSSKVYDAILSDWREYLHLIDGWRFMSPNLTPATGELAFLDALLLGKTLPRRFSFGWAKHRAYCNGDKAGGLVDFLKASAELSNAGDRLRFLSQGKPNFDDFIVGQSGMPILGYRAPADFPAELAAELMDRFCPPMGKVLDPCHGWGGRLAGFLLAKNPLFYTGVDASPETSASVKAMFKDLSKYVPEKTAGLMCSPFEKVTLDERFDFALTSPPYFDVEKYQGGEQSHEIHDSYPAWREGFYTTLIQKVFAALKPGGAFCLQVGSQSYPLFEDGKYIALSAGFIIEGVEHTGMTNNVQGTEDERGEVLLILRKSA